MITNPDDYLEKFAKAGCNWISVHIETCKNLKNTLKTIRSLGMQAGIAINPGTDLKTLSPYYDDCDYVLLMSVHPGFAGQKFIPDSLPRLQELVKIRSRYNFAIEVDGGIKKENAVHLMGADILVVGSGFYAESDYQSVVNEFKKIGMGWSKKHGST
jgi:ribulose-phosphate 3-epimerase